MKKLILAVILLYPVAITTQELNPPYLAFKLLNTSTVYVQPAQFNFYVDGSTTPIHALWQDCKDSPTATGNDVDCMIPFPPLGPGIHKLTLTQVIMVGGETVRESEKSDVFEINPAIATPFNLNLRP